tara:strand:+ start:634 stop:1947 length:1314 start_codon:yes stop_codon:yes gene_type:complete
MNNNTYFKNYVSFNKYLLLYLLILGFFAIIHLYTKHTVGNDSTISEWIINYQGGFIRRGFIGEICFHIAKFFNSDLRFIIFLLQSTFYLLFLFLTFKFFKNINSNILTSFAIFTPIFLLYPIAEVEVLARKEIFLYIYFLGFIFLCDPKSNNEKYINKYVFLITPIICLIYEEVVLFFPFVVACMVFQKQIKTFNSFFKLCLLFVPSLLIVMYFFLFPMTDVNHALLVQSLLINFNETCYMSCQLMIANNINEFNALLKYIYGRASTDVIITWIIRYFLIFLVGFFPLLLLASHSKIKGSNIFSYLKLTNIMFLMFFLYLPIIPLFIFGGDWGRWTGMLISFSTFFYFFLYKFNHINVDFKALSEKLSLFKNRKKLTVIIFIIFAFGWNQKTAMSGDIATNPLWKVPYNTSKRIFGWQNFKILQDHPLSIWHKKIIE